MNIFPDPTGSARTLREVLKEQQRLPARETVAIVRQIAEALVHAHETGVVHRDIKPENILLDFKGAAFLADFGCARRSRRHTDAVRSFVGTLPYMSLEQMEGCWNARTDLWSLGVMLYEMLSGTRPFAFAEKTKSRSAAEATFSFAAAIAASDELPPIPGVDLDLNAICRKCLQKEPSDRYDSAAALVEDLARWQRNEPVSCRRVGVVEQVRRWAQRNPTVATLLAVVALILAIGFGGSTYFAVQMWTARQRYVDEQLAQLDQFDVPTFDAVVSSLQHPPFERIAVPSLSSQWRDLAGTTRQHKRQHRLAMAILAMQQADIDPPPAPALVAAAHRQLELALLSTETPDEFLLIRRHAADLGGTRESDRPRLVATLWESARDNAHPAAQFRAVVRSPPMIRTTRLGKTWWLPFPSDSLIKRRGGSLVGPNVSRGWPIAWHRSSRWKWTIPRKPANEGQPSPMRRWPVRRLNWHGGSTRNHLRALSASCCYSCNAA